VVMELGRSGMTSSHQDYEFIFIERLKLRSIIDVVCWEQDYRAWCLD